MKRSLTLIAVCLFFCNRIFGQGVPNGDFESWSNKVFFENPAGMNSSNFEQFMRGGQANALKSTDHVSGQYSIKLQSMKNPDGDTTFGYFLFGNGSDNGIEGGIPYTQKPDSFKVSLKYHIATGTEAIIIIVFKNSGVPIGFNLITIPAGTVNTWTEKTYALNPMLVNPDTVAMGIASANPFAELNDPVNWIMADKMTFTGVTEQLPNNDFENWLSVQTEEPALWNTFNYMYLPFGKPGNVTKSTDAHSGSYSMSIKSLPLPVMGGDTVGIATTGLIGDFGFKGGFPVMSKADSLSFYYKYSNPGNPIDSGFILLFYTKTGIPVEAVNVMLGPSSSWKRKSIIFMPDSLNKPDTCNILLSSSLIFMDIKGVNDELKVDDMLFYYGGVGIPLLPENEVEAFLYPNPASECVNVNFVLTEATPVKINIYSYDGRLMKEQILSNMPSGKNSIRIDLDGIPAGDYILSVSGKGNNPYFCRFIITN